MKIIRIKIAGLSDVGEDGVGLECSHVVTVYTN